MNPCVFPGRSLKFRHLDYVYIITFFKTEFVGGHTIRYFRDSFFWDTQQWILMEEQNQF